MRYSVYSYVFFPALVTVFSVIAVFGLPAFVPGLATPVVAASGNAHNHNSMYPVTGAGKTDRSAEMPLAVAISDIHIGERYGAITGAPANPDEYCRLGESGKESPYVRCEFISFLEYCRDLKQKHGKVRYLIIMGDMWDLAMNNQEDSFGRSIEFFQLLNEQGNGLGLGELFENVIYLPGNHDHHFWAMLQERYWVTEPIAKGVTPLTMPRTISLTIDIPSGDILHNDNDRKEAGIPAQNIVSSLLALNEDTPVHVAYPHAFFKGEGGAHILMTHGHLLEPNWNMVTLMFGDLMKQQDIPLTIRNIEMFNAITTDWHSYSFGQTPPYKFWEEIYDQHFDSRPLSPWEQTFFAILKEHITVNDVQGDPKTPSKKYHSIEALEMGRELLEYYLAQAKAEFLKDGEEITALIYGHTHIPAFNEIFMRHQDDSKKPLWVHNTGGWVDIDASKYHLPSPVLIYKDSSVRRLSLQDGAFK